MTNACRLLTSAILRFAAAKRCSSRLGDFRVEDQLAVERQRDRIARHIVFGGPQAAGENHDLRAAKRRGEWRRQAGRGRRRSRTWSPLRRPRLFSSAVRYSELVSTRCGVSISEPTAMISAFIRSSGRPLMPTSTR